MALLGILLLFCDAAAAAAKSRLLRTLRGHDRWVSSLAISPDSKHLASGSDDQTLRVWNLKKEEKPKTLRKFDSAVTALAYHKDGKRLAVGTWDGDVLLVNPSTGKAIKKLPGHEETITTVFFDPGGKYLASGSADDTLNVWELSSGDDLVTIYQGNEYDVTAAAWSSDGEQIVTGDGENELKIWDASNGDELETLTGHTEPVTCVAYGPNGWIVSGSWDNTVRVWEDGESVALTGHTEDVTALVLDSNRSRIISASEDKTLRIWETKTGRMLGVLKGHEESISCLAISPDDRVVVSGSLKEIRIWELAP